MNDYDICLGQVGLREKVVDEWEVRMKKFAVTMTLRDVANGGGLIVKHIKADNYSISESAVLTFYRIGWASDLHISPNAWAWMEEVKEDA